MEWRGQIETFGCLGLPQKGAEGLTVMMGERCAEERRCPSSNAISAEPCHAVRQVSRLLGLLRAAMHGGVPQTAHWLAQG